MAAWHRYISTFTTTTLLLAPQTSNNLTMPFQSHYKSPFNALGLPDTASQDQVRKAYNDLALTCQPHTAPEGLRDEYTARFQEIKEANKACHKAFSGQTYEWEYVPKQTTKKASSTGQQQRGLPLVTRTSPSPDVPNQTTRKAEPKQRVCPASQKILLAFLLLFLLFLFFKLLYPVLILSRK